MSSQKTNNNPPKVLFVCTAVGARSLFAAGFANQLVQERAWAFDSGFENGKISKRINILLEEVGIPARSQCSKTVFQRFQDNETFDFVVTMCHNAKVIVCPSFRKTVETIYAKQAEVIDWNIRDFRSIEETGDEWMDVAREIRSNIKSQVIDLIKGIVSSDNFDLC